MFSSRHRWIATSCIVATIIIFGDGLISQPTCATTGSEEPFSDTKLDNLYDWIVYFDVKELPDYLRYPGSQLHPVTQVRISYRVPARNGDNGILEPVLYEDLWYANESAVGCRRYSQLQIGAEKQGAILVHYSGVMAQHTRGITNAVIRMAVDLAMRDDAVATLIVPSEVYDQVAAELGYFGFMAEAAGSSVDDVKHVSICMVSNPAGRIRDFYFKGMPLVLN